MKKNKQLSINLIAQVVSFVLNAGINFFLTRFIVMNISEKIYGFVTIGNSFTSYITIITVALNSLHSRYVTVNMVQKKYKTASQYFSSVTLANTAIAVVMSVPSAFFILFLDRFLKMPAEYVTDIKILFAFIFVSFLLSLAMGSMDVAPFCCNRIDLSAKRSMESNILKCIVLVIAYSFFAPNIWYVGLASLSAAGYVIFTNIRYVKKLTPELKIKREYYDWKIVKELVSNGIWSSLNQLTQVLMNNIDLLVVNNFVSSYEMNLLSFSKVITLQINNLMMTIGNIFAPTITVAYAEGGRDNFLKEVNSSMKISGFLCSVPIMGLMVFGQPFYHLWLPTIDEQGIVMIQILSVMTLLPMLFHAYLYPLCFVNVATCRIKVPGIFSAILGVLNVLGILFVINGTTTGLLGIKFVSFILLMIKTLLFIPIYAAMNVNEKWYIFLKENVRSIFSMIAMFVVYYAMIRFIPINNWIVFILCVGVAGVLGYLINFAVLLTDTERQRILQMVKNKLHKTK